MKCNVQVSVKTDISNLSIKRKFTLDVKKKLYYAKVFFHSAIESLKKMFLFPFSLESYVIDCVWNLNYGYACPMSMLITYSSV